MSNVSVFVYIYIFKMLSLLEPCVLSYSDGARSKCLDRESLDRNIQRGAKIQLSFKPRFTLDPLQ